MTAKRRVLIVDDEEDLVLMLSLRLQSTGLFELSTASDGLTGLEEAKRQRPDVLLLDNVMPGMDGWEVCKQVRAAPECAETAVVMMTAGRPEESRRRAREADADALLLKPYDPAEVVETLKTVGRSHAQASEADAADRDGGR